MSADLRVIQAVFRRNFGSYFAGVLGYAFIVGFVFVCALLAFRPQFFTDNLANLDQLSEFFCCSRRQCFRLICAFRDEIRASVQAIDACSRPWHT